MDKCNHSSAIAGSCSPKRLPIALVSREGHGVVIKPFFVPLLPFRAMLLKVP